MKKMNEKEFKEQLVEILKEFDKLCKQNDIKYSLIGGSLIGAIRHKGIIPWDDDIDVIMTKENYDKLLKIISSYKGNYRFINNDLNSEYYYPFLKMINPKTHIEEKYINIKEYGIYIDIFHYVNLPQSKIQLKFFWYKLQFLKLLISGYATKEIRKDDKYKVPKRIGKLISKIFGIKKIIKWYNYNINKYNNKNSETIIGNWPCYKLEKEIQSKENIKEYKTCEFEKINVMIFEKYDKILKTTFGDYMIVPPKEKQKNHGIKAYWR